MKNDQTSWKFERVHQLATGIARLLLSGCCCTASLSVYAQERFLLDGIFDAEAYETNQGSYSLSRNDGDFAGLGRLQLWSAFQASSNLQLYAMAELESDNSGDNWESEAEIDQLALRYSSNSAPYFVIEAGKILPPIAIFSERNLSTQNPLISQPDFLYVGYPLGISLTGSAGWLDYRAALVDKPFVNPDYFPGKPDAVYRPDLGLGVTPMQGLRLGLAYSKGPYLNRQLNPILPANRNWKDFEQGIWAVEFHFSRGYAELNCEWVWASYELPLADTSIDVVDYFAELKYTWTPRIYSALRLQRNQYPFIAGYSTAGQSAEDVTIHSLEIGLGYRFSADTQLKIAYQADRWNVAYAQDDYFPSGRSLGLQLSHQFDVKSWFGNSRRAN